MLNQKIFWPLNCVEIALLKTAILDYQHIALLLSAAFTFTYVWIVRAASLKQEDDLPCEKEKNPQTYPGDKQ